MQREKSEKKLFFEALRRSAGGLGVVLAQTCLLAGIVLFMVFPVSCTIPSEAGENLEGDYNTPVIENVSVVDDKNVRVDFSEPVVVKDGGVVPVSENEGKIIEKESSPVEKADSSEKTEKQDENAGGGEKTENPAGETTSDKNTGGDSAGKGDVADGEKSDNADETPAEKTGGTETVPEISYSDDGKSVTFTMPEGTETGKDYELSGKVEDGNGNSLTFSIPFSGYNGSVPAILMTEIQTESVTQSSKEKKTGVYRNEFIEFLALTSGNLAGLEIVSAYDGTEKSFRFPSVEVSAGEVFVVHLRKRGEGCISETGENLSLAGSVYASEGIRDLWSDSEETALGNFTDVIIVKNSSDGVVLDAAMFRKSDIEEWSEKLLPFAGIAAESGIYASSETENASVSDGKSAVKTLVRKNAAELKQKLADKVQFEYPVKADSSTWIVSAASPGEISVE